MALLVNELGDFDVGHCRSVVAEHVDVWIHEAHVVVPAAAARLGHSC